MLVRSTLCSVPLDVLAEAASARENQTPAVFVQNVYVADLENAVYGFDAVDGTELWKFETGDTVRPSPAVVDGVVYDGSVDENVYALAGQ